MTSSYESPQAHYYQRQHPFHQGDSILPAPLGVAPLDIHAITPHFDMRPQIVDSPPTSSPSLPPVSETKRHRYPRLVRVSGARRQLFEGAGKKKSLRHDADDVQQHRNHHHGLLCRSREMGVFVATVSNNHNPIDAFVTLHDTALPLPLQARAERKLLKDLKTHLHQDHVMTTTSTMASVAAGCPKVLQCSLADVFVHCPADEQPRQIAMLLSAKTPKPNDENHRDEFHQMRRAVWFLNGITTSKQLDAVNEGLLLWKSSLHQLESLPSEHENHPHRRMPPSVAQPRLSCVQLPASATLLTRAAATVHHTTTLKQRIAQAMEKLWAKSSINFETIFPILVCAKRRAN